MATTSTELAAPDPDEPGRWVALNRPISEVEEILADNIGDEALDEFDLPRVKVPSGGGKIWEVPTLQGTKGVETLEGIVVAFKLTRSYWSPDAGKGTPPSCKSDNAVIGIGDIGDGEVKQHECKTCPWSQYGTAINDKGEPAAGQACNAKEIWFLMRPDSFLPMALALPATSLKPAKSYRVGTLGAAGMRMSSVVTSIRLEQGKSGGGDAYSKIVPSVGEVLSAEEAARAAAYAQKFRPLFDAAAEAMATETGHAVVDADGEEV
jgi:hypothetical protein